ncbi:MAG: hypothetical protein ACYDCO_26505 [Armatimonadota bacterium]
MANFFKRLAGMPYIGNLLKQALDNAFDKTTGHSHDGTDGNGPLISAGTPAAGSVGNTQMAADAKVGSLAALNTTDKTSLQAALNEVNTRALARVIASGGSALYGAQIQLMGANPTQVNFAGADVAATLLGSVAEPYALTNGLTLVVDPDGAGDVTATFAGAQGTSISGAAPVTDLSLSLDTKLALSVDGGAATTFTFDWTAGGGCNDGTKIAAEMQTKIQAAGGVFAAVTVDYNVTTAGKYTIKSGTYGTGSLVVVTDSATASCANELKLGAANGGTEAAGTGDAVNLAATTADEVATKLAALAGLTATVEGGAVRITSDTAGSGSSLVVNAASTADLIFGITGTDYGEVGLGLAALANTDYFVAGSFVKDGAGVTDQWSVGNKATTGFRIYAETAGNTELLDLLIFGTPAA